MIDSYITLSASSCEEIIINKSRFIGYAAPCAEESGALAFLQQVREEHKTATHHCYAYIIGENSGTMRYSDDGEPGGTAGLPMMEVLRNRSLVNCCVVVVRYFGGVLLGTGGLVRAYTRSAQAAVEAAGISRMEWTADELCELPYASWDRFRYAAERLPVIFGPVEYGSAVSFHLYYRVSDREELLPRLQDASERKLEMIPAEESFRPWPVG